MLSILLRFGTWIGVLVNKRTSGDHPNYSIVEEWPEYWEESGRLEENCCRSDSSEKPSANASVKNSQKNLKNLNSLHISHLCMGITCTEIKTEISIIFLNDPCVFVCVCVCVWEREREREREREGEMLLGSKYNRVKRIYKNIYFLLSTWSNRFGSSFQIVSQRFMSKKVNRKSLYFGIPESPNL